MSEFWTWGNFASWEHCIEASRICNLRTCPDTMNCCVVYCMGIPTIKGIVLAISMGIITMFLIWVITTTVNKTKAVKKVEGEK